jgi:biotin transporter BioY
MPYNAVSLASFLKVLIERKMPVVVQADKVKTFGYLCGFIGGQTVAGMVKLAHQRNQPTRYASRRGWFRPHGT